MKVMRLHDIQYYRVDVDIMDTDTSTVIASFAKEYCNSDEDSFAICYWEQDIKEYSYLKITNDNGDTITLSFEFVSDVRTVLAAWAIFLSLCFVCFVVSALDWWYLGTETKKCQVIQRVYCNGCMLVLGTIPMTIIHLFTILLTLPFYQYGWPQRLWKVTWYRLLPAGRFVAKKREFSNAEKKWLYIFGWWQCAIHFCIAIFCFLSMFFFGPGAWHVREARACLHLINIEFIDNPNIYRKKSSAPTGTSFGY